MTRVNPRGRAGSVSPAHADRTQRKAMLFCPRCGHESPVDGDWVLTLRPDSVDVGCPDCRELLTSRPLEGETATERSARGRYGEA